MVNCPGKGFGHQFAACDLMYHKNIIPQSEEFTDFKNIVISLCALGSCHACLPLVPVLVTSNQETETEDKMNGLETNSKNKNIKDIHRGINDFKQDYKPRAEQSVKYLSKNVTVQWI
jgi:hypothetical protein